MAQRRVTLVEDRYDPKIHNTCGLTSTLENERVPNEAEIFNNVSQRDMII